MVNGQPRSATVPANRLLIHLLRDDLGLTGTKEGCSVGVCGACSVLVDGVLVSSCLTPAILVDGSAITTVEGLAPDDEHLSPLQESFIRHGGFQCGYRTSGMIMNAWSLLKKNPHATRAEIVQEMDGNLCRCGAHQGIIAAIQEVAR